MSMIVFITRRAGHTILVNADDITVCLRKSRDAHTFSIDKQLVGVARCANFDSVDGGATFCGGCRYHNFVR